MTHRHWIIAVLLAIGIAIAGVFYTSLFGAFAWDDGVLILANQGIQDFDHLPKALLSGFWGTAQDMYLVNAVYEQIYRPVVTLAYALQYHFFSTNSFGYHLVSLCLHVCTSLLAFTWLFRRYRDRASFKTLLVLCTFGALIFALHPSRTESVAWISGSTDLWMAFFVLLALLCWQRPFVWWRGLIGTLMFGLALLSKEASVLAPVVVAYELWALQGQKRPWAYVLLFVGPVAALVFRQSVVSADVLYQLSFSVETVQRVLASLGHYVLAVLFPWEPSAQRAFRYTRCPDGYSYNASIVALGGAVLLLFLLLFAASFKYKRLRPWLADSLWFFAPLLPVLNVFDLGSSVLIAERFLYLPILGLVALFVRTSLFLWRRVLVRTLWIGFSFIALVGFSLVTSAHALHFRSSETLWLYQYEVDPNNKVVIEALAAQFDSRGEINKALRLFSKGFNESLKRCDRPGTVKFSLLALDALLRHTPSLDQALLSTIRRTYDDVLSNQVIEINTELLSFSVPLQR
ncbi:MAG: hypothetical protein IPJ88_01635 [Myxococcales bacterium]|nr:MAG: hypothetical protein IPJ88_01635 [Myxococcales bacterium]